MLLIGDIGGTNTRVAVLAPTGSKPVLETRVPSRDFPTFGAALKAALAGTKFKFTSACFGIAGPVTRNRCVATNLPWVIDGNLLGKAMKIRHVRLVNDLVALAYGALTARKSQLISLNGPRLPVTKGANLAILAAGTGLGEAALIWDEQHQQHVPLGTEGSHSDFAPRDETEEQLRAFLARRYGRVSTERVVAGPGLKDLYEFFRDDRQLPEGERPRDGHDFSAEVTRLGLADANGCARAAVDQFVRSYGAEAGNVALRYWASGGVFVAGNIGLVLKDKLGSSMFRDALVSKGRFSPVLESLPVALVTDPNIGLQGAAVLARKGH
ncbi:MAG: glucokinase [Archangiaceae bacterium]|nr:glucokinase [Archangiaceae bacterium]